MIGSSILISPPFGTYLNFNWATSVAGSYTVDPRPGLLKHALKTIRPVDGGWVNRVGLRNPGIRNIKFRPDKLISLAALQKRDYDTFLQVVPRTSKVEINMGCPNVEKQPMVYDFERYVRYFDTVVAKMPPGPEFYPYMTYCYGEGIRYFHLCNTLPTKAGGQSGTKLKEASLKAIWWARRNLPDDVILIGGGGIYTPDDVKQYREMGADAFSLSTIFFKPWNVRSVVREIRGLEWVCRRFYITEMAIIRTGLRCDPELANQALELAKVYVTESRSYWLIPHCRELVPEHLHPAIRAEYRNQPRKVERLMSLEPSSVWRWNDNPLAKVVERLVQPFVDAYFTHVTRTVLLVQIPGEEVPCHMDQISWQNYDDGLFERNDYKGLLDRIGRFLNYDPDAHKRLGYFSGRVMLGNSRTSYYMDGDGKVYHNQDDEFYFFRDATPHGADACDEYRGVVFVDGIHTGYPGEM